MQTCQKGPLGACAGRNPGKDSAEAQKASRGSLQCDCPVPPRSGFCVTAWVTIAVITTGSYCPFAKF